MLKLNKVINQIFNYFLMYFKPNVRYRACTADVVLERIYAVAPRVSVAITVKLDVDNDQLVNENANMAIVCQIRLVNVKKDFLEDIVINVSKMMPWKNGL